VGANKAAPEVVVARWGLMQRRQKLLLRGGADEAAPEVAVARWGADEVAPEIVVVG